MAAPLRVIQVVNVRWFNATAWYGLFLSRLLKDAGHEVLVLGLPGTESFSKATDMGLSPVGMDVNATGPLGAARLMGNMRALLRTFQPHVVNCHRGEGMIFWGMLKSLGRPYALVRTRGDQRPPKGNLPNKFLHTRLADAVIATNSRTHAQCVERLGLAPERVRIIPGGVDTALFRYTEEGRQTARKTFGFADDDIVLGLLGRFDTVKGQRELIRAVSRIRAGYKEHTNEPWRAKVRLMLAGFPTTSVPKETVEGWMTEYDLEQAAVITGRYPDVAGLISAMDIGVIASQGSEAVARAAFEIMSCGVPLAGTDVGVMPDLLPPRALVRPGDEDALTALLERLLTDVDFRNTLREEEGEHIHNFSEHAFLSQTLRVYEEAMNRAGIV